MNLGVGRAGLAMPASRHDAAIADNHGTDQRIRRSTPLRIAGHLQRHTHKIFILQSYHLRFFHLRFVIETQKKTSGRFLFPLA